MSRIPPTKAAIKTAAVKIVDALQLEELPNFVKALRTEPTDEVLTQLADEVVYRMDQVL